MTITDHGLVNNQRLTATGFYAFPTAVATGMEQLNNRSFVIQQATANTFELWDVFGQPIDAQNYTALTGNGSPLFTAVPIEPYENIA